MRKSLKIGDRVRLSAAAERSHQCPVGRSDNPTAIIAHFMNEDCPGGVRVENDLRGCLYWNIEDLCLTTLFKGWTQLNWQWWQRKDNLRVVWDDSSPYPNPAKSESRMWVIYTPICKRYGNHSYWGYPSKKNGLWIPRRFGSAEAAIRAIDKEYPLV